MLYDSFSNRIFIDSLFYEGLTGEQFIDFFADIQTNYLARGVFPLADYGDGMEPLREAYVLNVCTYPFLKVKDGLTGYAFNSTPELRYKIGTYSYITGFELITDSDGNLFSTPYNDKPEFLVYTHSALDPCRFVMSPEGDSRIIYEVSSANVSRPSTPVSVTLVNPYYAGTFISRNGMAISLNLNDNLIADLYLVYVCTVVESPSQGGFPSFTFIY